MNLTKFVIHLLSRTFLRKQNISRVTSYVCDMHIAQSISFRSDTTILLPDKQQVNFLYVKLTACVVRIMWHNILFIFYMPTHNQVLLIMLALY